MKHSKKFAIVKCYYDDGLWKKQQVHDAVGRWIDAWEYAEITDEIYIG